MTEKLVDFSFCLICQKGKSEQLVQNPTSHEKVLNFLEEWARYGDLRYFDLWSETKICFNQRINSEKSIMAQKLLSGYCSHRTFKKSEGQVCYHKFYIDFHIIWKT